MPINNNDINSNEIRGVASFMGVQVSYWGKRYTMTSFEGPKAVFSPLDCLFKVESCKIKELPCTPFLHPLQPRSSRRRNLLMGQDLM